MGCNRLLHNVHTVDTKWIDMIICKELCFAGIILI